MKTIGELKSEIENLTHEYNEYLYSDSRDKAIEIIFEKKYPNVYSKYINNKKYVMKAGASSTHQKYISKYKTEIINKCNELVKYGNQKNAEILNEISAIERQIKIEGIIE